MCAHTMYVCTTSATRRGSHPLPASPPARSAKPRNSTNRAFHATPLPLYENESAERRDLSIEFMTSMPNAEQMPGIQSTKVICTGGDEGFMADLDHAAASIMTNKASEN